MKKIIEVKNLTVKIGGHTILEGLDFVVDEGEVAAIIGPNGSGKTTLIKVLLGLTPYTKGKVSVSPVSLGYVPQHIEIDRTFPLTVRELLLLKMKRQDFWLAGRAKKEVIEFLELTGAERLVDNPLGTLSGGEFQRVLIAQALIDKPKILFLDEPLAGVDIAGEETIQEMIERLHQKFNFTIVMVSHDLDIVFKYASKVICVNREMLCYGIPAEVLTTENLRQLYGEVQAIYHHRGKHHPS